MTEHSYSNNFGLTRFMLTATGLHLERLFGLQGAGPPDAGPLAAGLLGSGEEPQRCQGLALVKTAQGYFEGSALSLVEQEFDREGARLRWEIPAAGLSVQSHWRLDEATGTWSRRDTLRNDGPAPQVLLSCLSRFPFARGEWELYGQRSHWSGENQGSWQPLEHGTVVLGSEGGCTAQGGTPYAVLRDRGSSRALVFHLLPTGNWTMRFAARSGRSDQPPWLIAEMGLAGEHLHWELPPGGTLELPEVLIQALPEGLPEAAAPRLHRYLLTHHLVAARREAPLVYNTWFDRWDALDLERLRLQLAAAAEVGLEVFVIDAGWFGDRGRSWHEAVGDWRDTPGSRLGGQMADFAQEVRAAGLGFGLWLEPQRLVPHTPVVEEHPDWFLPSVGGHFYPDLTLPGPRDYLRGQIARLVEDCGIVWIKFDFNHDLGEDSSGTEFSAHFDAWGEMLEEMRGAWPQVFFEGCASGGLRSDLATLCHYDAHLLSDEVEALDVLGLGEGALLRTPPGHLERWAVPGWPGGPWAFSLRVALPSLFGVSGDLIGLSEDDRESLRRHVEFFKRWRGLIRRSVAHLLTPPRRRREHHGWSALQLQDPTSTTSLVFAYRLRESAPAQLLFPRDLRPDARYLVADEDARDQEPREMTGEQLLREGLRISLPETLRAAVLTLIPLEE